MRAAVYVDDFLLGAETKEKLQHGIEEVEAFFSTLGVVLSEKTARQPAKKVEFLGLLWDAGAKEVSVTGPRRTEYRREVKNLLRHPQGHLCGARWSASSCSYKRLWGTRSDI